MSESNPEKAIAALLPMPIVCECGATVRPITLGTYAALERVGSPLVRPSGEKCDAMALLPTLYILCNELAAWLPRMGDIEPAAVEWAEAFSPLALAEIQQAATRQVRAMLDVSRNGGSKKKARTTAG